MTSCRCGPNATANGPTPGGDHSTVVTLTAWGLGVLVAIAIAIVAWAWSVPDIVDADGDLVTDTARVQTRTLVVLLVGGVVMVGGGVAIARRGRSPSGGAHRSAMIRR